MCSDLGSYQAPERPSDALELRARESRRTSDRLPFRPSVAVRPRMGQRTDRPDGGPRAARSARPVGVNATNHGRNRYTCRLWSCICQKSFTDRRGYLAHIAKIESETGKLIARRHNIREGMLLIKPHSWIAQEKSTGPITCQTKSDSRDPRRLDF